MPYNRPKRKEWVVAVQSVRGQPSSKRRFDTKVEAMTHARRIKGAKVYSRRWSV